MDTRRKILIIQSYNPNKGDNSVMSVMLSSLRPYNHEISITAFDPEKAERDHGVKAFDYLLNFRRMKMASGRWAFLGYAASEGIWLVYSFIWMLLYRLGIKLPLSTGKKGVVEAYENADLVVLPGGHFFTSFNSLVNNFSHYYGLRFAQWLGKKTMVYSQTVGPYKNNLTGSLERVLANSVLKRANLVTLRERDSLKNYSGRNVEVTAETVFIEPVRYMEIDIKHYIPNYAEEPIVGVTIHHIYYKHYFSKEKYVRLMVDLFDEILSAYPCRILLIPMEDHYKTGGDRPIIREMISMVGKEYANRISMVTEDLSSTETANVISRCDVFVGTKTHSIVYGLKTATPTLSISYQEKSTAFMRMFGMGENAIPLGDLNLPDFMKIFDRVYNNREAIKACLSRMYPTVRKRAEYNNVLLIELLIDL